MRGLRLNPSNRCYHLISRVAHRAFFLTEEKRTCFVDLLWRAASFSGVEVLAYCIMTNPFHLLVYVSQPRELSDDELLERAGHIRFTGGTSRFSPVKQFAFTQKGRSVVNV